MPADLSDALLRQLSPSQVRRYAVELGWKPVAGVKRPLIVLNHPTDDLTQIQVPTAGGGRDSAFLMGEAVRALAEFEQRPAREVLGDLLMPPSDVLRFREVSPDAETGNLPFGHAVRLLNGTRKLLLSAAHSVLAPRPFHPRLARGEAEEFVERCRLGQTERGSFVLTVACPLDLPAALFAPAEEPFARRVTGLLMQSLEALSLAASWSRGNGPADPERSPGLSANLCESLLLLRPAGDRASLTVSAAWSRALLPSPGDLGQHVQLRQEVFDLAEALAPRLRSRPEPHPSLFVGYVTALHGQPTPDDPRPAGEVRFALFDQRDEEYAARADLTADEHAVAGQAYLAGDLVSFRGVLHRLPRLSRIEHVTGFERIRLNRNGIPQEAGHDS